MSFDRHLEVVDLVGDVRLSEHRLSRLESDNVGARFVRLDDVSVH